MRAVINISLPQAMASLVNDVVDTGKYTSKSEFFRSLLRGWLENKAIQDLDLSREELRAGKGKLLNSLSDLA